MCRGSFILIQQQLVPCAEYVSGSPHQDPNPLAMLPETISRPPVTQEHRRRPYRQPQAQFPRAPHRRQRLLREEFVSRQPPAGPSVGGVASSFRPFVPAHYASRQNAPQADFDDLAELLLEDMEEVGPAGTAAYSTSDSDNVEAMSAAAGSESDVGPAGEVYFSSSASDRSSTSIGEVGVGSYGSWSSSIGEVGVDDYGSSAADENNSPAIHSSFAALDSSEEPDSYRAGNPPTSPPDDASHTTTAEAYARGEAEERRRWMQWLEQDTAGLDEVDRSIATSWFMEHGPQPASTYLLSANDAAMLYGREWVLRTAWRNHSA